LPALVITKGSNGNASFCLIDFFTQADSTIGMPLLIATRILTLREI